jgi:hypothetical protein
MLVRKRINIPASEPIASVIETEVQFLQYIISTKKEVEEVIVEYACPLEVF